MRRLLTVVMIAVLALPLFAGGGAESTAGAPDEIRKITFPLAEPVEIRIATPDGTSASLANSLPVWQEIERLTNVRIVWDAIPSTQYNEVMKLRVSAGTSALPDIMMVPNGLSVAELGQQGIIIPLQDQLAVNGQDILRVYDELPMVRATTTTDGNIYTINSAGNGIQTPYSLIIRQDWLDRLGLETPETLEEWMTVLRAVRDEDANGNGDPDDEIPFSAGGHAWYTTFWGYLWDLNLFQSDGWHGHEDGTMTYDFISDDAFEFYTWLNGFYHEGLLDPEFMTLGGESALYAKVSQDKVFAFTAYPSQIPMMEDALRAIGVEDAYLKPLAMPEGPRGRHMEVINTISSNGYAVTSACRNPDVAVALLNFVYGTEKGRLLLNFGIEGVTYTVNADGTYEFTDLVRNDPDGRAARDVLSEYGCTLGLPYVRMQERDDALLYIYSDRLREDILTLNEETSQFATEQLVLPPATEEESNRISGISGNISSYIWEMTGKFTVGEISRAAWDEYVDNIRKMGLDDLLAVKQAQYDRLMANY